MLIRVFTVITGLLATSLACARAHAEPKRDPHTLEILGLHLGLHKDEVLKIVAQNIKDAAGEDIRRDLVMGEFTLPNVLFGYRVKQGKDTDWNNVPYNTDVVQLNYSLSPDPVVMYITRVRVFDDSTAPAISSLAQSIHDKYGQDTGREGGGTQNLRMFWVYAPIPQREPNPTMWVHSCAWELSNYDANPFGHMRYGEVNFSPDYLNNFYPKCGISMMVDIEPSNTNNLLAHSIIVSLGDYQAFQTSDHYILDLLRKGAADKAASEAKKAAANKTPL